MSVLRFDDSDGWIAAAVVMALSWSLLVFVLVSWKYWKYDPKDAS